MAIYISTRITKDEHSGGFDKYVPIKSRHKITIKSLLKNRRIHVRHKRSLRNSYSYHAFESSISVPGVQNKVNVISVFFVKNGIITKTWDAYTGKFRKKTSKKLRIAPFHFN